jgi:hypothetical protein
LNKGKKLLNGGVLFGDFKNFSQDFDFGVNFLLFEKKKQKTILNKWPKKNQSYN